MALAITFEFLANLFRFLGYLSPLFVGLILIIAGLSFFVGRIEKWDVADSLYFGFITALTVGYGDFRPERRSSKILAIVIAVFGLITSGILVAVAIEAVKLTFAEGVSS